MLSLNVHRDIVGNTFLPPFYRGESWGAERVATCLTSYDPAPGHCTHWGQAGPFTSETVGHWTPEQERGDLGVHPFVSPHPRVSQPPPQELTLPTQFQTPEGETYFPHQAASVCIKMSRSPQWRQVSTATAVRSPVLYTWNVSYVVTIICSLDKLHPRSHPTPQVLSSAGRALHWSIKIREYPTRVWHILHPSIYSSS